MNIWGLVFIGMMVAVLVWSMYLGWRLDVDLPAVLAVIFCCSAVGYVVGLGAKLFKTLLGW